MNLGDRPPCACLRVFVIFGGHHDGGLKMPHHPGMVAILDADPPHHFFSPPPPQGAASTKMTLTEDNGESVS